MEMSTWAPRPVRSRWYSGVADAGEGVHAGVGVADAEPTNMGGPSGSPVMCMTPT